MVRLAASYGVLTLCSVIGVRSVPITANGVNDASLIQPRGPDDWQKSLSEDTRHRLKLAQENLSDKSHPGLAFRNDTIMRNAEDFREQTYTRGGVMTYPKVAPEKRSNAEDFREQTYTRGGAMTYPKVSPEKRSNAEDFREQTYTRGGVMTYPNDAEKRDATEYSKLLDRKNLALGAIERINIAHRVQGKPEITLEEAKEMSSHGDEYVSQYWQSSMTHAGFWTTDQATGKPNFVEGGQLNGFGFTQSTYHKLHCLANLRMMLTWHITGNGSKMTRDMNVHAIHCLEYVRGRELEVPDLNEEPIDTVDYKGMGIH
ncbi:hypothetical protein EsDP_00007235 [Epichloe bromicola]|uniref:SCP domain-containing protein n=1 Tax=Epichloe bromicola TaxID=79588 RepID=A0ABQ0CZZ8_9HYPO